MKKEWICTWEVIPGNKEQKEKFSSLAEAKQAMRQKICQYIDLQEYIGDLEPQVAEFLGKYLSDPQFPGSKQDVPKDYEEPEYGDMILDAEFIRWDYPYDAYVRLNTNLVLGDDKDEEYTFNFWYEYPEEATGTGARELAIRISPHIDYGTSAYPLMVWHALRQTPQTQDQLVRAIMERWDTCIDRKAVGRHLKLLQDMGFAVQHGPEGYFYGGENRAPETGIKYGTSAYVLMVCESLDDTPKTIDEIVQEVYARYGVKIDRKAVGRHLKLLFAMEFRIEKRKAGYCRKA